MKKCRRVHHKKEDYDVFVARPSKWGSPFSYKENTTATFKVKDRAESVEKHKEWLLHGDGQYLLKDLHELRGKVLGCWCNSEQSCHADILVELVNNLGRVGLENILF